MCGTYVADTDGLVASYGRLENLDGIRTLIGCNFGNSHDVIAERRNLLDGVNVFKSLFLCTENTLKLTFGRGPPVKRKNLNHVHFHDPRVMRGRRCVHDSFFYREGIDHGFKGRVISLSLLQ